MAELWSTSNPLNVARLNRLHRSSLFSQVQTNNTSTSETNLTILTTLAASLTVDGDRFDYQASGAVANNANAKTLRLYVGGSGGAGGTLCFAGSLPTSSAAAWITRVTMRRTGATTLIVECQVLAGSTVIFASIVSVTVTLSGAFEVRMTGQGGATSDVLQYAAFLDIKGIAA